jgi:hypothetical protein
MDLDMATFKEKLAALLFGDVIRREVYKERNECAKLAECIVGSPGDIIDKSVFEKLVLGGNWAAARIRNRPEWGL